PNPHYQAVVAVAAAATVAPAPSVHMQQLMEQQAAEEMRKSAKRAANRRSASTCRVRKKFLVENMAGANNMMRERLRVLSLLPDMILAMRRDGVVTYASENCRQFLKFTREQEVQGANIFDIVESGSHERLRRLLEENLGSVSKETIASALRHQGTTFEDLLARCEKAKEQGDTRFFAASGEALRMLPGPVTPKRAKIGTATTGATNGVSTGDGGRKSVSIRDNGGGIRKMTSGSGSACTVEVDGSTVDCESEVNSMSACEIGGSGIARKTDVTSPGRVKKSLRPFGIAGRGVAMKSRNESDPGVGPATRISGRTLATLSAAAAVVSSAECKKAKEGDINHSSAGGSDSSGDGSVTSSQGAVSVDRDLQSEINAFTNSHKELCKLEIVRQDKKSDWYEVRSSMRLVWLKNKQEIVPVEVICSFQPIHMDGPAGSANSIVARLQRVVTTGRSLYGNTIRRDYLSGQSASSGFSASGESNCTGGSGDLISEGDTNSNSSSSCHTGEAVSSSDYGGGTSSGSLSGDGDGDSLDNDEESSRIGASSVERRNSGGSNVQSRKRSRARLRSLAQKTAPVGARRAAGRVQENSLGVGEEDGGGDAAGDQGSDQAAVDADEMASAAASQTPRILPPTARWLALTAKKTILMRHGFDSQNGARAPLA
ncbi:unnamed protein product, partial [Ascophyllum nodosum]